MQNLDTWTAALRRQDDCLVGEWPVPFFGSSNPVEVSFQTAEPRPTARQYQTFAGYLDRCEPLHAEVLSALFAKYQSSNGRYREVFSRWGEDPDVNAPILTTPRELLPLILLQTVFIPDAAPGSFGLGFWSQWEQEHGVGVRFNDWALVEVGDNDVHFAFD